MQTNVQLSKNITYSRQWLIVTRYFSGETYETVINIEINKDLEFEAKYGDSTAAIRTHLNEAALQTWCIRHAPLFH